MAFNWDRDSEYLQDPEEEEFVILSEEDIGSEKKLSPYQIYLLSDHWYFLRREALHRAGHKCENCLSVWYLQVHHKIYRKTPYDSVLDDLEVLCSRCHGNEHFLFKNRHKKVLRNCS
jgi:hypothetical protein